MKKVLIAVAVMSLASVATADLMLGVTRNPDPQAGLESYTLTFTGVTPGDKFSAFDGSLRGPMSQTWYFTKGAWDSTVWVGDFFPGEEPDATLDSHLLVDNVNVIIAVGADEAADTTTPLGTTPAGYTRLLGTYMANSVNTNMAFAVPVAFQLTVQPFAQLVIPAGQKVHVLGTGVGFNAQGLPIDIMVPEPATLGLLAFGAVGALIRRRRR